MITANNKLYDDKMSTFDVTKLTIYWSPVKDAPSVQQLEVTYKEKMLTGSK